VAIYPFKLRLNFGLLIGLDGHCPGVGQGEIESLLRKYEFGIRVQAKTFIIEVLGLHFRDGFNF